MCLSHGKSDTHRYRTTHQHQHCKQSIAAEIYADTPFFQHPSLLGRGQHAHKTHTSEATVMSRYIMYVSVRKKRLSWGGRGVQPPRWCVCVLGVVCSDVTAVLRCTSATGGFVFVLFGQRRLSSWSHGSCSVLGMWMEDDASAVLRLLRSGVRLRGGRRRR